MKNFPPFPLLRLTEKCLVKAVLLILLFSIPGFVSALDYYWVNGSGNWSDFANHWAKVCNPSGPGDFHLNVPTAGDDVFFTGSGTAPCPTGQPAYTVFVDASTTVPKCRNMNWMDAPNGTILDGSATGRLDIYGSLVLNGNMSITFPGEIHFITFGAASTITSNGVSFPSTGYVHFEGTTGGWMLNDAFTANGWVFHNGGILMSNNQTITVGWRFEGNSPGRLELGDSDFILNGEHAQFYYAPADFLAGTSHIIVNSNGSVRGTNTFPDISQFHDVTFNVSTIYGFQRGNIGGTLIFHEKGVIASQLANSQIPLLNQVVFEREGTIFNATDYNHLTLAVGETYVIQDFSGTTGTDQTILPGGTFTANGGMTCNNFITIKSWKFGTPVEFVNNSGNDITVTGVVLEDVHASGMDDLIDNFGVNVSNNTGWLFTNECPAVDLYWIGGPGDWDKHAHWSLSSGGPSCSCSPNQTNNVIFDANSGFSASTSDVEYVQLVGESYCKNMDWQNVTGNPTFIGTSPLYIYGSMLLAPSPQMTYYLNNNGNIRFRGGLNQINHIQIAGQLFPHSDFFFEGEGEYQFDDPWNAPFSQIEHINGKLKLMGHTHNIWRIHGNFDSSINSTGNPNSELWMGDPVSGISATMYSDATAHPCCVPGFRASYGPGKFHAMQSHIIFDGGQALVDAPLSNTVHDFWDVSFLNLPRGLKNGFGGNFSTHNIQHKLTYTGEGTAFIEGNGNFLHEVELQTNGIIAGNHTYDTLTLTGGKTYEIQNNSVQTISATGMLNMVNNDCENKAYLFSYPSPTVTAKIAKAGSGSLSLNHAILDNILPDLTTGATYSATNSIGLQPTVETAWNITNPPARTLYWVGGDGAWHDAVHWSLSSGGTGGECPPTPLDDVFFNASSGLSATDKVTILQNWAFCKDMDWTGSSGILDNGFAPTSWEKRDQHFGVFGNLKFTNTMVNDFDGIVWLRAGQPATITSAGNQFKSNLYFWNPAGDWTLMDNLNVSILGSHSYGIVHSNNKNITLGWGWGATGDASAELFLGSSEMKILGNNPNFNYGIGQFNYQLNKFHSGTSSVVFKDNGNRGILSSTYNHAVEFYDVTFEAAASGITSCQINNKLLFKKSGVLYEGFFIKELEFEDDGDFSINFLVSGRQVHAITFAPGKRYTFYHPNYLLDIVPYFNPMTNMLEEGQFIAQGLPGQYIEIKSSNPSAPAFIHMDDIDGGTTCTKYLFLTGLTHTGTEEIYVPTPGGDVFNNTGWQFFPCNPCPASIPLLDPASVTAVCTPSQATLILAGLKADEWANWYTDPAAVTNLVYTGGNLFQPNITGPATYYARVYSDGALCESTVVLTVDITTDGPLPAVFNVTGGGNFCAGNSGAAVGLDGSETSAQYQLLLGGSPTGPPLNGTGAALSFGIQNLSGTYTVQASVPGTICTLGMNGNAVLSIGALPAVDAGVNSLPCPGPGPLQLTECGGEAVSWSWTGPAGFASTAQNPAIPNPTYANVGTYTITVSGANGCTSSDDVSFNFSSSPVALCQNVTAVLDGFGQATLTAAQVDNGSYDNCGPVTLSLSNGLFNCGQTGPNTVTLTATSAGGISATCTATVTVLDIQTPTPACYPSLAVVVPSSGTVTLPASTFDAGSDDNCGITLSVSQDNLTYAPDITFDYNDIGNTVTVYLRVQDASGNFDYCVTSVNVSGAPPATWYKDMDNDSYSDGTSYTGYAPPPGYQLPGNLTATSGDCDDNSPTTCPGAPELCNGLDDDCNGYPEAATNTWTALGDGLQWSDPANWSDGLVPLPCQDVVIPGTNTVLVQTGFEGVGRTLEVMLDAVLTVDGLMDIKN